MRSVTLNIQHVAGRKALLIAAGLGELQNAVNLEGATLVFCRNMLEYLAHYGQIADGGDPMVALLETAKSLVGVNYQAECAALITRWLSANAGTGRRSAGTPPPEDRITRSSWFVHEHDEVAPSVWKRASVRSPANCAACHVGAEQGRFDEHALRIPK